MHTVYLQGSAGVMAETAQTVNWSFSPITVQEMACCEDSVELVQHESNPYVEGSSIFVWLYELHIERKRTLFIYLPELHA